MRRILNETWGGIQTKINKNKNSKSLTVIGQIGHELALRVALFLGLIVRLVVLVVVYLAVKLLVHGTLAVHGEYVLTVLNNDFDKLDRVGLMVHLVTLVFGHRDQCGRQANRYVVCVHHVFIFEFAQT